MWSKEKIASTYENPAHFNEKLPMDTAKRVALPIPFVFYCSATHVTSQVLQPEAVNKRYRGRHTFSSVHSRYYV